MPAFRELFERYHDRVYRYAYVRLGSKEEANDALQDVFLGVWRGLPRFRYEHEGSFPAWLFGIARNVVAEHRRKTLKVITTTLDEAPEDTSSFEGLVASRSSLTEAISRLPEAQREVIALRFIVGLTGREAAASLGKSEAAVSRLQLRGLNRLRKEMAKAE